MGLDQYLYAKKYYSDTGFHGKDNAEMFESLLDASDMKKYAHEKDENYNSMFVEVQCAYWRKAYQIHQWFVDNVQRGDDNCAEYYVSREDLRELVTICEEVLQNRDSAKDNLPNGECFDDTEYDDWYFSDVEYTVDRLNKLLSIAENDRVEFYYSSSW